MTTPTSSIGAFKTFLKKWTTKASLTAASQTFNRSKACCRASSTLNTATCVIHRIVTIGSPVDADTVDSISIRLGSRRASSGTMPLTASASCFSSSRMRAVIRFRSDITSCMYSSLRLFFICYLDRYSVVTQFVRLTRLLYSPSPIEPIKKQKARADGQEKNKSVQKENVAECES